LTRASSHVILSLVMAALLHFDLPRTRCAGIGCFQPIQVDVKSS